MTRIAGMLLTRTPYCNTIRAYRDMSQPLQDSAAPAVSSRDDEGMRHGVLEDVQAIVTAALLMALGVALLAQAHLAPGGTLGLAFILHYATDLPIGRLVFLVNLPFYWFAVRRMGWTFTLKTICAVAVLALFSEVAPHVLAVQHVQPVVGAILGGTLAGIAMMILYRHGASFGGITILAAYLQDRIGLRAGYFQMSCDVLILLAATRWVPLPLIFVSLFGAAAVNVTLAVNHRPGRYAGF